MLGILRKKNYIWMHKEKKLIFFLNISVKAQGEGLKAFVSFLDSSPDTIGERMGNVAKKQRLKCPNNECLKRHH